MFYLHGSSISKNSYFYVNFLFFESTLEIAVLPAWELNYEEISSRIYVFLVFLWFPEKVSFCFSPFFSFYHILVSFWEAAGILFVAFGILRALLGLVWAVFGRLLVSFVWLLGHAEQRRQKMLRQVFSCLWKTRFYVHGSSLWLIIEGNKDFRVC